MEYKFTINDFEGPLDLLLHLISKKEIDIIDIDVSKLADQYVAFIKEQQELSLEIASEFLIMASYLIELKSKAIIPIEEINFDNEFEQSEKHKLIQRLIEYKKFKKSTAFFEDQAKKRDLIFTKNPESLTHLEIPLDNRGFESHVDTHSLTNALNNMLKRLSKEKPLDTFISGSPINHEQLEIDIIKRINNEKKFSFISLFSTRNDRAYIVSTIICVLDLTKNKILKLSQDQEFGEIIIERA